MIREKKISRPERVKILIKQVKYVKEKASNENMIFFQIEKFKPLLPVISWGFTFISYNYEYDITQ